MSMTFGATKPVNHPKYGQILASVFPDVWLNDRNYIDPYDVYEVGTVNPDYRPDLDINLSNANAEMIINLLGYAVEDGCFSANIDEFIARATQYLQKKVGKPSAGIKTEVTIGAQGCTMYDCGTPDGYNERTILRIVVMAREGKKMGATEISGG